jgi:uncharacterized protein YjdB
MKRYLFLFVAAIALTMPGCENAPPVEEPIKVTSVSVAPATLELAVGQTSTLVATVLPADAANKAVEWTSSAPTIVSVNPSTGLVTALAEGGATITAKTAEGGFEDTCTITVNDPRLDTPTQKIGVPEFQ